MKQQQRKRTVRSVLLALALLCFFVFPFCSAQNWQKGSNWNIGSNWDILTESTSTPMPTATPGPSLAASPLGLTEIVLVVIWLAFVAIAFISKEPVVFGIAGIISVIVGLDFGLLYLGDISEWVFGVVGFAQVMFGFFMLFMAYGISNQGGKKK